MSRKPRKGKTRTRWRGPEGKALVGIVNNIIAPGPSCRKVKWEEVSRKLKAMGYGVHDDPDKLKADYHSAANYWDEASWSKGAMRGPDGLALVDLVEDVPYREDGEIDWPRVLKELHPSDRRMTAKRLRARYEMAVEYWTAVYRGHLLTE